MAEERKTNRKHLWVLAAIVLAVCIMYLGSYLLWTRVCPGERESKDGITRYSFTPEYIQTTSDWEYSIYYFYWPLVKADCYWGKYIHEFRVIML